MADRKTVCRSGIFLGLLLAAAFAPAQHVSGWFGGGIGSFFTGSAHDPNGHKFTAGSVSFPRDHFRVRYIQGSLERSKDLPSDTGDNDMDYFGFDAVVSRKATGWPVDIAAGVSRFEEAYHDGYPDQDRGGSVFVHRWGPHVRPCALSRSGASSRSGRSPTLTTSPTGHGSSSSCSTPG